jgi:hypothetical protein
MDFTAETLYCDGCGVEITCKPISKKRLIYCCQDCADGAACTCGDRMEAEEWRKSEVEIYNI